MSKFTYSCQIFSTNPLVLETEKKASPDASPGPIRARSVALQVFKLASTGRQSFQFLLGAEWELLAQITLVKC